MMREWPITGSFKGQDKYISIYENEKAKLSNCKPSFLENGIAVIETTSNLSNVVGSVFGDVFLCINPCYKLRRKENDVKFTGFISSNCSEDMKSNLPKLIVNSISSKESGWGSLNGIFVDPHIGSNLDKETILGLIENVDLSKYLKPKGIDNIRAKEEGTIREAHR